MVRPRTAKTLRFRDCVYPENSAIEVLDTLCRGNSDGFILYVTTGGGIGAAPVRRGW